jgi:hypothetical protein
MFLCVRCDKIDKRFNPLLSFKSKWICEGDDQKIVVWGVRVILHWFYGIANNQPMKVIIAANASNYPPHQIPYGMFPINSTTQITNIPSWMCTPLPPKVIHNYKLFHYD